MKMLLRICGNCKTYKYNNYYDKGGCSKNEYASSPLCDACNDFKSK